MYQNSNEKIKDRLWGIYLIIPKMMLRMTDLVLSITDKILEWVDNNFPELDLGEAIEEIEEENKGKDVIASIGIRLLTSNEILIETISFRKETEEDAKRFATLLYLTHSGSLIKKTLDLLELQEKSEADPKDKQFFNWTRFYWHHLSTTPSSEELPPLIRPSEVLSPNG